MPLHYNQTEVNQTASPNIDYLLTCQIDDPFCTKVENGIKQAIAEFAKVIDIRSKIIIKIKYYSFCTSSCSNSSFGFGIPSSQFILPFDNGTDLNHVYPQALSKQLVRSFNSSSVWSASDVTIELNHDAYMASVDYEKAGSLGWNGTGVPPTGRYWFANDTSYNNTAIDKDQVDFRYVFLHELLHGLGFLSSWAAYFWSTSSPFRRLVEGVLDDDLLKVITPGMYWHVDKEHGGPTYITGFQPTMIFDKYLVSYNSDTNYPTNMSQLGFSMQNFCKDQDDSFILNFLPLFHNSSEWTSASHLWDSMAERNNILFDFAPPLVLNSSYLTNSYLNQTYRNMTLLTGSSVLDTPLEQFDQTSNRPSAAISHVDDDYNNTVDFLMTQYFISGRSLEDITQEMYQNIPVIYYNITSHNNSIITKTYASPIGPGILRILDSMGYSTALTNTSYMATGTRTQKFRSSCSDINDSSPAKAKPTETTLAASSNSAILQLNWIWVTTLSGLALVILL
ncbi:unnamed protein product [Absidia cylindrospora]